MTRLSKNQKIVLLAVEQACRPSMVPDGGGSEREAVMPFYVEHLPRYMFDTERERERFLENLEARGLIRIHKRYFLYITDAGRAAALAQQAKGEQQ